MAVAQCRSGRDPNLAGIEKTRTSKSLINKYDEPLLNENAVKAQKHLLFGRK
jgi:hypothetical protein